MGMKLHLANESSCKAREGWICVVRGPDDLVEAAYGSTPSAAADLAVSRLRGKYHKWPAIVVEEHIIRVTLE